MSMVPGKAMIHTAVSSPLPFPIVGSGQHADVHLHFRTGFERKATTITIFHHGLFRGFARAYRLLLLPPCHAPNTTNAFTGLVTRLLVPDPEIQGLSIECELLCPVTTLDR